MTKKTRFITGLVTVASISILAVPSALTVVKANEMNEETNITERNEFATIWGIEFQ